MRAAKFYKRGLKKVFKSRGLWERGYKVEVIPSIIAGAEETAITARVFNRAGDELFYAGRIFGQGEISLEKIEVAGIIRRRGLARAFYEFEPSLFRKAGFKAKETSIISPVTSPFTGKLQEEIYASKSIGGHMMEGRLPGKDDAYNTIEGFKENGFASKIRKFFGFGSGWRGIIKLPSSLNYVLQGGKKLLRKGSAMDVASTLANTEKWLGKRVSTIRHHIEKNSVGGSLPEKVKAMQKEWDEVHEFYLELQAAKQAGHQTAIGLTPAYLERASYRDIKRTILHERGHQGVSLMTGKHMTDPTRMNIPVPSNVSKSLASKGYAASEFAEEAAVRAYSHKVVPQKGAVEMKWAEEMPWFVEKGKEAADIAYKQKMKLIRRWHETHRTGVIRASRMSKQGARGHLRKTGAMPF